MNILRRRRWRLPTAVLSLSAALAVSLTMPVPSLPDDGVARVRGVVQARLPGWTVERVQRSWEGAFSVVARCAGREIGFQYVPGHGLPVNDAWLQPSDPFSRERLAATSDHWRHLLWYGDPAILDSLSCEDEIAGEPGSAAADHSDYD
jgi:hypothetical protein